MDEKKGLHEQAEPPPSYDATECSALVPDEKKKPQPRPGPRPVFPLDIPAITALKGKRVILASASPRRRQLLSQIGIINPEVIPSNTPEDLPKSLSPFEYVLQTAQAKAEAVYQKEIDSPKGEPVLLLAADTVVVSSLGDILEKPRSEREHIAMLKKLRDSGPHRVYTAVVAMKPLESATAPGYALENEVEETVVAFDRHLTDDLLMAYVKTREGADKAGGYGIQGTGAILVERIEGSFDNVVGLPLRATLRCIEKVMVRDAQLQEGDLDAAGEGSDEHEE